MSHLVTLLKSMSDRCLFFFAVKTKGLMTQLNALFLNNYICKIRRQVSLLIGDQSSYFSWLSNLQTFQPSIQEWKIPYANPLVKLVKSKDVMNIILTINANEIEINKEFILGLISFNCPH